MMKRLVELINEKSKNICILLILKQTLSSDMQIFIIIIIIIIMNRVILFARRLTDFI
jgi:hypothetical protein